MKIDPKFISAPGGGRLVILTEEEYNALLDARDDADDLAAAINARKSIAEEGAIPADVSRAIRAGTHPIAAWRAYRNLSQAMLALTVNVSQAAIARIEGATGDAGKPATRRAIAEALGAPLWAIELPRGDGPATVANQPDNGAANAVIGRTFLS
jgi:DNA-binding XRE family transcriptional regulator